MRGQGPGKAKENTICVNIWGGRTVVRTHLEPTFPAYLRDQGHFLINTMALINTEETHRGSYHYPRDQVSPGPPTAHPCTVTQQPPTLSTQNTKGQS